MDIVKAYLKSIVRRDILSREEEVELFERMAEGTEEARDEARQELILSNLGLAISMASAYARKLWHIDLEDLIQEANIALIKAIDLFDLDMKTKLSTYAAKAINRAIQRFAWGYPMVRVPEHVMNKMTEWAETKIRLAEELGTNPTHEMIASAMGMNDCYVFAMRVVESGRHVSLGWAADGSIEGYRAMPPDAALEDKRTAADLSRLCVADALEQVERCMEVLDEGDRTILKLRLGWSGPGMTLKQIADRVGFTKQWVSVVVKRSRNRVRREYEVRYGVLRIEDR